MAKAFFDKDQGWDKLMSQFSLKKGGANVSVGYLRSGAVHKSEKGKTITMAQLAAIHEFGSSDGRIPERSFMRSSITQNKASLKKLIDSLTGQIVDGKISEIRALGIIGQTVKQNMQAKIRSGLTPPLKPETIRRKGSSKPLIDTGQLINSIEWEVKEGK